MSESTTQLSLSGDESSRRRKGAMFPGFIALSVLAHAATFLLFQVVYPRRVTLPQSPPDVFLLTPSTPERAAFLRWVDSEDPALVAAVARAEPPQIHEATYRPSYSTVRTPPRIPVPQPEEMQFPSAREPLAVVRSIPAPDAEPVPKTLPQPAMLTISGSLAARRLTKAPAFSAKASEPVQSTEFLIGVTDRGEVRFCFLQKSSGDAAVDETAERQLSLASFEPAESPITWGRATIDWADAAYPPPAPPRAKPRRMPSPR